MNSKKIALHGFISFAFWIFSIYVMATFPRKNDTILTQREFGYLNLIILILIAIYLGLVNIRDTDYSAFRDKYSVRSISKIASLLLLFTFLFVLIIDLSYWYFYENVPLTLTYLLEVLYFPLIITNPIVYTGYMIGLKLYFVRSTPKTDDN